MITGIPSFPPLVVRTLGMVEILGAVGIVLLPILFASANLVLLAPENCLADEPAVMLKKLDRPFRVMDDHLAARAYLPGDRFTVADLIVSAS